MTEFQAMLERHRKLAGDVSEQRGYLEFLEGELAELEKQMNGYVSHLQEERVVFDPTLFPPLSPAKRFDLQMNLTQAIPKGGSKALQETAQAIAELGDGVDAARLAGHLHITREAARLRLQRASKAGLITRMASGRYRTTKRKPQETKPETTPSQIQEGQAPEV
jgi:hypothetical protein